MKASVSAEADRELTDGALHYAREGGAQVGMAFIAEFERVLELLCAHSEIGAPWRGGRRRIPVRKFPCSIV
jgi:plasmid stabilization system protein ParE